ncbi:unnamed protein product [Nezara viridula]|uniref:Uncharacterized protein n=1 Tax=Nezara viridula TaxID=85310 RepID=A0A9P0MFK3_NEZVI|nr:unnamed protein product [Nezara viridula]
MVARHEQHYLMTLCPHVQASNVLPFPSTFGADCQLTVILMGCRGTGDGSNLPLCDALPDVIKIECRSTRYLEDILYGPNNSVGDINFKRDILYMKTDRNTG